MESNGFHTSLIEMGVRVQLKIIITVVFVILITVALFFIENRSNIPSIIIIPILVLILTKYVLGDWDRGFRFTLTDIFYFMSILAVSYITMLVLSG